MALFGIMLPIERKLLADAIEKMSVQFPVYLNEEVVEHLMSDDVPGHVLLGALVEMTDGCLDRYENGSFKDNDSVDTLAQSAGVHAVRTLAHFGLMKRIDTRRGQWTAEGKLFLVAGKREWNEWKDRLGAKIDAKQNESQIWAGKEKDDRKIRWAKYALIAGALVAGAIMAGQLAISSFRAF
jgi:hypothetical protein